MENNLTGDQDLAKYISLFTNWDFEELLVELRKPEINFTLTDPVDSKEALLTQLYNADNISLFTCGWMGIDYDSLEEWFEKTDDDFGLGEDDYDPQDDYGEIGVTSYRLMTLNEYHIFTKEMPFGEEEYEDSRDRPWISLDHYWKTS
jgi:hypothetical protein